MKLLIITQKVDKNDSILGFMHRWIEEFSKHCTKVTVICLQSGEYSLPNNVEILSLGKERGVSRLKYLFNFYRYILSREYDKVFVHMNPEYVLLGGLLWILLGKRISLWYAHGYTPQTLVWAEKMVDVIFTSTSEGCRLSSSKISVVGQGVDVDRFKKGKIPSGVFKIVSIGRISPVKDLKTLQKAVEGLNVKVEIVGGVGMPEHQAYHDTLRKDAPINVSFIGPVSNGKILPYLQSADLFVNTSLTGSMDKAVLEAMAVGIPVLTCNEAFREILPRALIFEKQNPVDLSLKISHIMRMTDSQRLTLGQHLRDSVVKNHNLSSLVKRICDII